MVVALALVERENDYGAAREYGMRAYGTCEYGAAREYETCEHGTYEYAGTREYVAAREHGTYRQLCLGHRESTLNMDNRLRSLPPHVQWPSEPVPDLLPIITHHRHKAGI